METSETPVAKLLALMHSQSQLTPITKFAVLHTQSKLTPAGKLPVLLDYQSRLTTVADSPALLHSQLQLTPLSLKQPPLLLLTLSIL